MLECKAMKRNLIILLVLIAATSLLFVFGGKEEYQEVSSFEECVSLGNPVMESYPRQCRSESGEVFTENIGNEIEKSNLIRVFQPRPNTAVASPLVVKGESRGNWFFEASFLIELVDENGTVIANAIAEAKSDWMTVDFVPFEATLIFSKPETVKGEIVLIKDNPSGLPEHDDELRIPVAFSQEATYQEPEEKSECRPTGCSGQICSDEEVVTTCEFSEEYACYEKAVCERQESGECGWTETQEFNQCISEIE